jgi:DNA-binding response OmpR family regulator
LELDLIILDVMLPKLSGFDLRPAAAGRGQSCPDHHADGAQPGGRNCSIASGLMIASDSFPLTRTVDTHIAKVRQKIESAPNNPRYLLTVQGVGYKFIG